nr:hypothetical protein CFP56_28836 [Quercus suber]
MEDLYHAPAMRSSEQLDASPVEADLRTPKDVSYHPDMIGDNAARDRMHAGCDKDVLWLLSLYLEPFELVDHRMNTMGAAATPVDWVKHRQSVPTDRKSGLDCDVIQQLHQIRCGPGTVQHSSLPPSWIWFQGHRPGNLAVRHAGGDMLIQYCYLT